VTLRAKDNLVILEIIKNDHFTSSLTPKQKEICDLIKEGLSNKAMAFRLSVSPHTISNHLKEIYKRLGTKIELAHCHSC